MSTTKHVHPLLTETGNTDTKDATKALDMKKAFVACVLFIAVIAIVVTISYMKELWPFKRPKTAKAGIYGKYPVWGGNIKNQQIALNSKITKDNLNTLHQICLYNGSQTDSQLIGYITVDNDNNGYFGTSGFVRSINLDSCKIRWTQNVTNLLNYTGPNHYQLKNTASLFQTNNNEKCLLFGTEMIPRSHNPCYVVAIRIEDGSLLWKTILGQGMDSTYCQIHGCMIDQQYAYCGMSSDANKLYPDTNAMFIGRMSKININNGQLISQWYSIPKYNINETFETDGFYSGASFWPFGAIIDEYFVFGSGQLYTYPHRVQQCLMGNITAIPKENVHEYNLCEQDMRDTHLNWRCLEKNVYPDSLIILNKNSFNLEVDIPLAGVDAWNSYCWTLENKSLSDGIPNCPKPSGPDADAAAIATYHSNDGKMYVAVGQKSGQFYVIEIPNGNVKVIKKVGPWSQIGGSSGFSLAVDEQNMIAVYTIRGARKLYDVEIGYKYRMADGTVLCDGSGSVYFIDLNTGYTKWEWISPYSQTNELCNDAIYDEYVDITINGTCERAFNGSEMLSANETVTRVVIPPVNDDDLVYTTFDVEDDNWRNIFGPVTVNNGMVFITTRTGDIFIHDILTGDFIDRLQCPNYRINSTHWTRAPIRSGVTIFEDRVIYNCKNQIVSMKLESI
eukprot:166924_1